MAIILFAIPAPATIPFTEEMGAFLQENCNANNCHTDNGQGFTVDFSDSASVVAIRNSFDLTDPNVGWRNFLSEQELETLIEFVASIGKPAHQSLSPENEAADVALNANLVITFDAEVSTVSGDITIRLASDNSAFETIDVTSANVTGSGTNLIVIDPSGTFEAETEYYVQIDSTAFEDSAGNAYPGIYHAAVWGFTTGTEVSVTAPSGFPDLIKLTSFRGNPFLLNLKLNLSQGDFVQLNILDALGRLIETPLKEYKRSGSHQWEIKTDRTQQGVYYLEVIIGNTSVLQGKLTKVFRRRCELRSWHIGQMVELK